MGSLVSGTAVDGLVVAKRGGWASMFEMGGKQVLIRPTTGAVLGTILRKDHPIAKAHPELFTELRIEPDYDTEG
jgi:hypothetical protein